MSENVTFENTETNSDADLADFSSLNLCDISPQKKIKTPRRVLHFSDGTLEEYSSDEDTHAEPDPPNSVNPKTLPWAPWMAYWASHTGTSVLSACDYVGEGLANVLGITSQKYFYEIEDYQRNLKQEAERQKELDSQMAGWTTGSQDAPDFCLKDEPINKTELEMSEVDPKDETQNDPDDQKEDKKKF